MKSEEIQTKFAAALEYTRAAKGVASAYPSGCRVVLYEQSFTDSDEKEFYVPAKSIELMGVDEITEMRDLCEQVLTAHKALQPKPV